MVEYYDHSEFQNAKNKEEVCSVSRRKDVIADQDSNFTTDFKQNKVSFSIILKYKICYI